MIEFAPVTIAGNTLRRHWLATFERDGQHYFFADSKRPGHLAGPYASIAKFIDDYAAYRGRDVIAFRVVDTYERRTRAMAVKKRVTAQPVTIPSTTRSPCPAFGRCRRTPRRAT